MTIMQIVKDLFFHSIIIISVFERLKLLYQSIRDYKNTKNSNRLFGEIFILIVVIVISVFLYKFFIYK